MHTVLIVDDDLNFVFRLSNALDRTGYEALPAKNILAATELLNQINFAIDLVIVNSALRGFVDLVGCVSRMPARVIVVAEPSRTPQIPVSGADVIILKPPTADERWISELLDLIRSMIARGVGL